MPAPPAPSPGESSVVTVSVPPATAPEPETRANVQPDAAEPRERSIVASDATKRSFVFGKRAHSVPAKTSTRPVTDANEPSSVALPAPILYTPPSPVAPASNAWRTAMSSAQSIPAPPGPTRTAFAPLR